MWTTFDVEATMNAQVQLTGVPIDAAMIAQAGALGVDVGRACEQGLRAEIKRVSDALWIEENRAAMEASNRWVEENGLPGARYRMF